MDFKDAATEDIYEGKKSAAARRALPQALHDNARRKIDFLDAAKFLEDVKAISSVTGQ